eukprot:TRINITY_DN15075_c0_g1_i1.p1 TRINITY_DN15075_c0_g1~~TRINITY_DN15075_c0_g1_i1.p1  ORF type:complete len:364 (+),score=141.49 TRINITY_DN15075_c0_g1_i1:56-1093(+)
MMREQEASGAGHTTVELHAAGPQNPTPFASVGAGDGGVTGEGMTLEQQYAAASQGGQQNAQAGSAYAMSAVSMGSAAAEGGSGAMQHEWERLRKFQEELNRKEKMLKQREMELGKHTSQNLNWPRHVPCIKPQVYHDIDAEITPLRTKFMKALYSSYYALCLLIVYQLIVDLMVMLGDDKKENDDDEPDWSEHFGLSVLYLLGICFGFMLWYWPTYKALANRIPSGYRMSFLGLIMAIIFDIVMVVGYIGHGGLGILFTTGVMDKKKSGSLGTMALVGCICWFLHMMWLVYAFYRVRKYYTEDVVRHALPDAMRNAQAGMASALGSVAAGGGGGGGAAAGGGRQA